MARKAAKKPAPSGPARKPRASSAKRLARKKQKLIDDGVSPLPDDPSDDIDTLAASAARALEDTIKRQRVYARKLTIPKVRAALKESGGIMSQAAEALGVSRTAVYNFVNDYPELRTFRDEIREELLDTAESSILLAMMSGNLEIAKWYLTRMGVGRGWAERHQFQHIDAEGKPYDFRGAVEADRPVLRPDGPLPSEVVL